ncbi:super-infection exclusion protein B [Citrobacter sp. S-77]|uniref:super-infection exclusion protein B n=1 Tax=Citrobacter sp. S-77 TaxID=1080067 RepID=UPI0005EFB585|nr:super-infection exclusion protein B [Citrobacter sp. S-77]
MSDDRLTFARFFAEKEVIQLLITIVIFSLILIFSPNNLHELIVTESGIPYAMYIFSFAVAYLIGRFFMSVVPLFHRGTQMKRKLKTLNSLSTEQLLLLEPFLKTRSRTFLASWDNPYVNALVKAGIVRPVNSSIDGVSVIFKIEPEYEPLMLSAWNPCTRRFDISR